LLKKESCRARASPSGMAFLMDYLYIRRLQKSEGPMNEKVQEFNEYRSRMNDLILSKDNLVIKRLYNLDTNTYAEGALPVKTKELMGLVASMVLRCDDCIKYHLGKCYEEGVNTAEIYEVFAVANIVGGTIVIPHTRRAAEYWEALHGA
jgi:AhpD family alkylhydroperoxidase